MRSEFVFRSEVICQFAERPILVGRGGNDLSAQAIDPSSNCEMCDCTCPRQLNSLPAHLQLSGTKEQFSLGPIPEKDH